MCRALGNGLHLALVGVQAVFDESHVGVALLRDESDDAVWKTSGDFQDCCVGNIGGDSDAERPRLPKFTLCETSFVVSLGLISDEKVGVLDVAGLYEWIRSTVEFRRISWAML